MGSCHASTSGKTGCTHESMTGHSPSRMLEALVGHPPGITWDMVFVVPPAIEASRGAEALSSAAVAGEGSRASTAKPWRSGLEL